MQHSKLKNHRLHSTKFQSGWELINNDNDNNNNNNNNMIRWEVNIINYLRKVLEAFNDCSESFLNNRFFKSFF